MRKVTTIGVMGCGGTIGADLCILLAFMCYRVIAWSYDQDSIDRARKKIEGILDFFFGWGAITWPQRQAILARIEFVCTYEGLAPCDGVFEAIREDLARDVQAGRGDKVLHYQGLKGILKGWLATTTSSILIRDLEIHAPDPKLYMGSHYFNRPFGRPKGENLLLELIRGTQTDEAVFATNLAIGVDLGKIPVELSDTPGFGVNSKMFPPMMASVRDLEERPQEFDALNVVMRVGAGHPMNIYDLLDLVGADTSWTIGANLEHYGDASAAPPDMLQDIVTKKYRGRKDGRGIKQYLLDHNLLG